MADNKKYYYLKLKDNYFDQDNIKLLEAQENGHLHSLIIIKLYLKACKYDGQLKMTETIPYNPKDINSLATVIGHDVDNVKEALRIAMNLNIITILESGEIWLTEMQNFIGESSSEADRKREYRNSLKESKVELLGHLSDVRPPEIEIELELKKEKEKKKDRKVSIDNTQCAFFEQLWQDYPNQVGKKLAYKQNKSYIINKQDDAYIITALNNYKKSDRVMRGFIQNGSTWFNNWRDWIKKKETKKYE